MSDGKDYEIFVQNLQQALLDSEEFLKQKNIKIERNKKIKDRSGVEREFDLYWEYELGGVTYKTIIECKDYKSRVSIEKIDALIGKLHDLPDLKPVFATKTGYQSGAQIKAKNHKIDLLVVREQNDGDWQDCDGNPYIKEVVVNMTALPSSRITGFTPFLDKSWAEEHTSLDLDNSMVMQGLNTEIFIEDKDENETFSLFDLAQKLDSMSGEATGRLVKQFKCKDAYLVATDLRLKIFGYKVEYVRSEAVHMPFTIDYSKELKGVIEYFHKSRKTAVFKDKIVHDW